MFTLLPFPWVLSSVTKEQMCCWTTTSRFLHLLLSGIFNPLQWQFLHQNRIFSPKVIPFYFAIYFCLSFIFCHSSSQVKKVVSIILLSYYFLQDFQIAKLNYNFTFSFIAFTFLLSNFISAAFSSLSYFFRSISLFKTFFWWNSDFNWTFLTIYSSNLSSNAKYFYSN